jgi:HK97 family phage major capsid protein
MALTLGNSNITLPREVAQAVHAKALETSLIGRLVTPTPLGLGGKALPIYGGGVQFGVTAEGQAKPVSDVSLDVKYLNPVKVAAITIVSTEMLENDIAGVMTRIEEEMGSALAVAVDTLAIHAASAKTGTVVAGQTGLAKDVVNSVEIVNGDYKSAILSAFDLVGAEWDVNAVAFDSKARSQVLKVTNEVALGLPDLTGSSAMVAGAPAYFSRSIGNLAGSDTKLRGIAGQWDGLAWGYASEIVTKRSTEASIVTPTGTVNLFQDNLVALLSETHIAATVVDPSKFALIVDKVA